MRHSSREHTGMKATRMKTRLKKLIGIGFISSILVTLACPSEAQTFDELLQSRELQKLERFQKPRQAIYDGDPTSNFASIWDSNTSPGLLLTWLAVGFTGHHGTESRSGIFTEYAGASIMLRNKEGIQVRIDVQVPKPSYTTMARYKTLASFNRFRPPTLDVIAEQVIPIQGIDANYYRTRKGECSLLFNVEKMGIVNLSTKRCADSRVMMGIAKSLDFARLNQKLTS